MINEQQLEESVKRLDTCYATFSEIDLNTLLTKDRFPKRICYCVDTDLWLVGNARSSYHYDMVKQAYDKELTNISEDDNYGKFYYFPHYYNEDIDDQDTLRSYVEDEFLAANYILVYDDCIIGVEDDASIGLSKLQHVISSKSKYIMKCEF